MVERQLAVAILAAGKGTRMRSNLPKVLHKLGSLSLIERLLRTVLTLGPHRCLVIVGYQQEQVRQTLADYPVEFVEQREQLGTGHAVQQLLPLLPEFHGDLLVINGDVPLLRAETLQALVERHRQVGPRVTLLSAQVADPYGYGRVFCDAQQRILELVEERDCTPAQRQNRRVNSGVYCFDWVALAQVLPKLTSNNAQQEYYLTDAVGWVGKAIALDVSDPQEIVGVNDRRQLAQAHQILQDRLKDAWMEAGVTFVDPDSVSLEETVQLAPDVIIEPQTHLRGTCRIGSRTRLGPGSLIDSSTIGTDCQILYSVVSHSQIGDHVWVGPYAHVRPHSQIADYCRIGNFVETKNAQIGSHSNAAHLSYLGDAKLGSQVNIGAGTIIANYDGQQKHFTEIGDRSKTGANSVLVAPLKVGSDVTIAAGTTIPPRQDLPDDCLAIARPHPVIKPGWRLGIRSTHPLAPKTPSVGSLRIYPLRLCPGQDLKQELEQFARQQPLQAGFVLSAVGSLTQATLRLADQTEDHLLVERLEILALHGSLCADGLHLHLTVADCQGKTWGGHLRPGCLIYTTAELVLADSLEHRFSRQLDPTTGYLELQIEQAAADPSPPLP
ncbi:bifunctional UDP-N-acetylglucosamine diphosphorylase/glucosamine-1-phosphate N-acetyltransferase GlmU [Synechococcus bigranulatus str. 'Rupite']|uniref:Bifunctional protein GlmU n=1 Tax=Thermostichus vulcanus str. 'Rupite' TaxID=2813851 RepID=A0ABT0CE48_THEVL|nr:bifunctional UDP-N-acetylglucosamine diphosphorylase/glucosamine-1-phosphate N-acetyltransferase GlmU [Thermostichus vulcanus]MCJ2544054.1 bifunctional UDP-N-acetylglucosamine diphosphorylase/glucosamine-1-phosphate N-acetyltransferase GlmU [Thermostichus vulcanus str. 'Rupite']